MVNVINTEPVTAMIEKLKVYGTLIARYNERYDIVEDIADYPLADVLSIGDATEFTDYALYYRYGGRDYFVEAFNYFNDVFLLKSSFDNDNKKRKIHYFILKRSFEITDDGVVLVDSEEI